MGLRRNLSIEETFQYEGKLKHLSKTASTIVPTTYMFFDFFSRQAEETSGDCHSHGVLWSADSALHSPEMVFAMSIPLWWPLCCCWKGFFPYEVCGLKQFYSGIDLFWNSLKRAPLPFHFLPWNMQNLPACRTDTLLSKQPPDKILTTVFLAPTQKYFVQLEQLKEEHEGLF